MQTTRSLNSAMGWLRSPGNAAASRQPPDDLEPVGRRVRGEEGGQRGGGPPGSTEEFDAPFRDARLRPVDIDAGFRLLDIFALQDQRERPLGALRLLRIGQRLGIGREGVEIIFAVGLVRGPALRVKPDAIFEDRVPDIAAARTRQSRVGSDEGRIGGVGIREICSSALALAAARPRGNHPGIVLRRGFSREAKPPQRRLRCQDPGAFLVRRFAPGGCRPPALAFRLARDGFPAKRCRAVAAEAGAPSAAAAQSHALVPSAKKKLEI